MKTLRCLLCLWLCLTISAAYAMDGEFDRSADIAKHLEAIKTGTRITVIDATRDIFLTGISDPRLGAALSERLLREIDNAKGSGVPKQYMESMVRALAATSTEYGPTLQRLADDGQTLRMNAFAKGELGNMAWYKKRNEVMASRKFHRDGADVRIARTMNLLVADDFRMKEFGADRMNWDRILDSSLFEEIARQIPLYMNQVDLKAPREQVNAMGYYAKLLGFSGNLKYRELLETVLKSKAHSQVKKHAKGALADLRL